MHREVTIPVVIATSGDRREAVVSYDRRRATVGDLARALSAGTAPAPTGRLQVDDRCPPPDIPLERVGLRAGDLVRCVPADGSVPTSDDDPPAAPSTGMALRVVGGLLAGTVLPLPPGSHILGRHGDVRLPAATIASRQARLDVHADGTCTITDLGTGNPVRVDGVAVGGRARRVPAGALVEIGAVHLQLSRLPTGVPVALPPPDADGTVVLDRPLRHRPEPPQPRVRLPAPPQVQRQMRTFGWATLLVPVAFGAVTALVLDPRYALFAALGPVMALAGWVEDRRRGRAAERDASAAFTAALGRLRHDLHVAASVRLAWCSAALPDPAELVTRAVTGDRRLWERRSGDDDAFRLRVGVAARPWSPVRGHAAAAGPTGDPTAPHPGDPTAPHPGDPTAPHPADEDPASQIAQVLRRWAWLDPAPVAVDLGPGRVVGIAGDRTAALAVARSLVLQAAVLHGPADLVVAVAAPDTRRAAWRWVAWLPHVRDSDGRTLVDDADAVSRILVGRGTASATSAGSGTADTPQAPHLMVVVDADPQAARGIARRHGGATLVVAAAPEHLPATCTATVRLDDAHGLATFHDRVTGEQVHRLLVAGVPETTVHDAARALARWRDPERAAADQLPGETSLMDLLGGDLSDTDTIADTIADGWRTRSRADRLDTPVGTAGHGTVTVDLVDDGPHALVAGTTGSGKSELLRSLVLGLAARHSPTRVNFLLIDYKGGSTFDGCADLPHTVGVVTDLDGDLTARVLRCLSAELRRRERILRAAGARDLRDHRPAATKTEALPRLVVVVDEFAALAGEVPDHLPALVDIAQRGRALGLHLVLATQRPRGVVDDRIRANVDLRIALRVQDAAESLDVLGVPAAALLPRDRPGRALLSVGGTLTTFQAAAVRPVTVPGPAVAVRPMHQARSGPVAQDVTAGVTPPAGGNERADQHGDEAAATSATRRLVDAVSEAHEASAEGRPRSPWLPPLAERLPLTDLPPVERGVALGLADDPDAQQQVAYVWDPRDGNLLCQGVRGSGTSSALATAAVALATAHPPDALHLYVLAHDGDALAPLVALPHVGALASAVERERQERLLRHLGDELQRRRSALHARAPTTVLLVDDLDGFATVFDPIDDITVHDQLRRLAAEGPAVGMAVALTAPRLGAVPPGLAALFPHRLLLRLPDRFDYATVGLHGGDLPPPLPGRAVDTATLRHVQLALPSLDGLRAAVRAVAHRWRGDRAAGTPVGIGVLPTTVSSADLAAAADLDRDDWQLPVGIGDRYLAPVGFRLGPGEAALVAGPPRSGKSAVLISLARVVTAQRPEVEVAAIAPRRSPLASLPDVDRLATDHDDLSRMLTALTTGSREVLLLVDDAELVDGPAEQLRGILERRPAHLRIVAAGRSAALRGAYGHWTAVVRRSRHGLALRPQLAADGDLWDVTLPRPPAGGLPVGRGYLVEGGEVELVQAAAR